MQLSLENYYVARAYFKWVLPSTCFTLSINSVRRPLFEHSKETDDFESTLQNYYLPNFATKIQRQLVMRRRIGRMFSSPIPSLGRTPARVATRRKVFDPERSDIVDNDNDNDNDSDNGIDNDIVNIPGAANSCPLGTTTSLSSYCHSLNH